MESTRAEMVEKLQDEVKKAEHEKTKALQLQHNVKHSREACRKYGIDAGLNMAEMEEEIVKLEAKIESLEKDRKESMKKLGDGAVVHDEMMRLREARNKIMEDNDNLDKALEIMK